MNTLRQAIDEYLSMRRGLGFKLQSAGNGLLDFVAFMKRIVKIHAGRRDFKLLSMLL